MDPLSEAAVLFQNGETSRAEEICVKALAQVPGRGGKGSTARKRQAKAEAHRQIGERLFAWQDFGGCADAVAKSLSLVKGHADSEALLSTALYKNNRLPEAFERARGFLAKAPDDVIALCRDAAIRLGRLNTTQGQADAAREAYAIARDQNAKISKSISDDGLRETLERTYAIERAYRLVAKVQGLEEMQKKFRHDPCSFTRRPRREDAPDDRLSTDRGARRRRSCRA